MVKYFILLLISISCSAKTIKVAIIDTGIDTTNKTFKLCKTGSKDFTNSLYGYRDFNGHGTHIASIIKEYAGKSDYCFIILKYYADNALPEEDVNRSNKALKYALSKKVDIINYSGGGELPNKEEFNLLKKNKKTIVVAALGNNGHNLDNYCEYYPACYNFPNIIRVGNMTKEQKRYSQSNSYSKADYFAVGVDVKAIALNNQYYYMSGTSQSTAKVTGSLIKRLSTSQVSNGLTYKVENSIGRVLDIIECSKWHKKCININK